MAKWLCSREHAEANAFQAVIIRNTYGKIEASTALTVKSLAACGAIQDFD
jgi:hypothetical protein